MSIEGSEKLILIWKTNYYFVWQRLTLPNPARKVLQTVLKRPNFQTAI